MLFTSNSGRINNVKEFYLDNEVGEIMKPSRFAQIVNPRSIHRADEREEELMTRENFGLKTHDYDLEQGDIFAIRDLKPLQTKKFINLEAYPHLFENDLDVLTWSMALISESPLALSLITAAQDKGWSVCLNDLGTDGFHIDVTNKVIELDHFGLDVHSLGKSAFFRNSLICVLAKALRVVWHEENWGNFEVNYTPEAVLMLERARAADADSVSVVIAWELRGAGYNDIWRFVIGSEFSDMAQVLTNILERYPTALYNGMAMAHVFRQWYADSVRVDALDHSTLEHMDNAIEINGVSNMRFGTKNVRAQDFEKLSTLPDGIVFLKELGDTVCKDPFFNALHDAVNQAHLFQIVYDAKVTYVNGIPFRDEVLARKFLRAD